MALLVTNNANTTLAADISDVATSISVATGTGELFPSPTGADYALVTLDDGTNVEIVKCTARSGDTLTVTRAQESTTAKAFASGTLVQGRLTVGAWATKSNVGHTHVVGDVSGALGATTGSAVQKADGSGGLTAIVDGDGWVGNLNLPVSTPHTPTSGLDLGSDNLAYSPTPRIVDPTGRSLCLQTDIIADGYSYITPNWNSGWSRKGWSSDPSGTTAFDLVTNAPTNAQRRMQSARYLTTATPGTVIYIRGNTTNGCSCFNMRASGVGRWRYSMIFAPWGGTVGISDARGFWGLRASNSNPTNVAITTLLDALGVGIVEGSANLHVVHADGSTNATDDLGANFPSQDLNQRVIYLFTLEQAADGYVYGSIINLYTGARATWTWTTYLPTGGMTVWSYLTNNASSVQAIGYFYGAKWRNFV